MVSGVVLAVGIIDISLRHNTMHRVTDVLYPEPRIIVTMMKHHMMLEVSRLHVWLKKNMIQGCFNIHSRDNRKTAQSGGF